MREKRQETEKKEIYIREGEKGRDRKEIRRKRTNGGKERKGKGYIERL